jgi:hypothetical protein
MVGKLANISDEETVKLIAKREDLKNKFIHLLQSNREFEYAITQGTGSMSRVKLRFAEIKKLIQGATQ